MWRDATRFGSGIGGSRQADYGEIAPGRVPACLRNNGYPVHAVAGESDSLARNKNFKRRGPGMRAKTIAVVAAAFVAGLFVSITPGTVPDVAAGSVEDSRLIVPNFVPSVGTLDRLAAMWVPMATASKRTVQVHRRNAKPGSRIDRTDDWPFCDPACLQASQQGRDRLPQESIVRKKPALPASIKASSTLKKPVPLGCDPAFSPVADPAHADVYKRCIA